MLLKEKSSNHMVEITNLINLIDVNCGEVVGQYQEGEEAQDPEAYTKSSLVFLSGESLPRCWTDPHYRDEELTR
ncbi:MAG: acetyltransferase [Gammaproteobacteria bacterium]|nr:acetyltransferase [Gammaproteobacteria bacterium]